eukprot:g2250.t1
MVTEVQQVLTEANQLGRRYEPNFVQYASDWSVFHICNPDRLSEVPEATPNRRDRRAVPVLKESSAMGSAASTQLASATAEDLQKIYQDLPEETRSKLLSAMATAKTSTWTEAYGVLGCFASKDPATTMKLVLADAAIQVKEEKGAPWFSVMGHPNTPESDKDKAFWVAAFHSKEAYHQEHTQRPSNKAFVSELMATCATGNPMVDMMGTYRGSMYYTEKSAAQLEGTVYAVVRTWTTKDAKSAEKMLDMLKADGLKEMELHPDLLQIILFPTVAIGGDVPEGAPKDDRMLKSALLFKSLEAMEQWKKGAIAKVEQWKELMEDPSKDYIVLEFGETKHFTK